jgi:hypothetical protein
MDMFVALLITPNNLELFVMFTSNITKFCCCKMRKIYSLSNLYLTNLYISHQRGYYTAVRRYECYLGVVKTIGN